MHTPSYDLLNDGIGWGRVYFSRGSRSPGARVNEVQDPPYPGFGLVLIMDGPKTCTLFCPTSFKTFTVSHRSMEYSSLRRVPQLPSIERVAQHLKDTWTEWSKLGLRVDFGTAAVVLKKLGFEAPDLAALIDIDLEEPPANRKGKSFEEELKKPVKRKSKRGKVLEWFLADGGGPKSIPAAMAEFETTRNNILSYLFMLNKDHGIGYHLNNSTATVVIPGGADPFEE